MYGRVRGSGGGAASDGVEGIPTINMYSSDDGE